MKSKTQKNKELADSRALLDGAMSVLFVDFSKTPVAKVNGLKATLRSAEGVYKVMKKRLFKILFQEKNLAVDMDQFNGQFAAIFSKGDITQSAGPAFKFSKEREKEGNLFALLGGVDIAGGIVYSADEVKRIGQLPSRDILLAQLAGILNAPVKKLAYVLSEIGKSK